VHSLLFPAEKENHQVISCPFCLYSFMFTEFCEMKFVDEFTSEKDIFEPVIVVQIMLQILLLCSDEKFFHLSIFHLRLNDKSQQ
jgi:hypothetical protein